MPNTPAMPGTIAPAYVFTRPICLSSRNSGIIATCAGITSTASSARNIASRPRKRSFANA